MCSAHRWHVSAYLADEPVSSEKEEVPASDARNVQSRQDDRTSEVIKTLEVVGIDYLIPIGGDDTLSVPPCLSRKA